VRVYLEIESGWVGWDRGRVAGMVSSAAAVVACESCASPRERMALMLYRRMLSSHGVDNLNLEDGKCNTGQ